MSVYATENFVSFSVVRKHAAETVYIETQNVLLWLHGKTASMTVSRKWKIFESNSSKVSRCLWVRRGVHKLTSSKHFWIRPGDPDPVKKIHSQTFFLLLILP